MKIRTLNTIIIFLYFVLSSAGANAAELAGYAKVSGYVKDAVTKAPLREAKIRLRCGIEKQETSTDSSGYYEFPKVPIYKLYGIYFNDGWLIVSISEYKTEMKWIELFPGQNYTQDFFLETRFKYPLVTGQVIDKDTAAGIEGATVTVGNEKENYSCLSDASGKYTLRIENKRPGEYTIIAAADGYQSSESLPLNTFPTQTYIINFILENFSLGVNVSPDTWHIGNLSPYSVATMNQDEGVTVTNSGNAQQTYSLMVVSLAGWTASQDMTGSERYVLNASFSSSPDIIVWDEANHALSEEAQRATETKFAADQTGTNTAPGQKCMLWLQFKAPTATALNTEQHIEIIINAENP